MTDDLVRAAVDPLTFWTATLLLGVGTFGLRFGMLAALSSRPPPPWLARALRFTPAAVLPALAAPLIAFDGAGAWRTDPAAWIAVVAAVGVGLATRNVLATIGAGMGAFWLAGGAFWALGLAA